MYFDAIIFDLDGTIIDSEHLWQAAARELILSKGRPYTKEMQVTIAEKLHGVSKEPSLKLIKEIANLDEDIETLAKEKEAIVRSYFAKDLRFVEGFEGFFSQIEERAFPRAVATNSDSETVKAAVHCLNLHRYFGPHIYHVDLVGGVAKPHPKIYLYAAAALFVKPQRCLVIEDSAVGIASAKAAEMTVIGINTGKDTSRLTQADFIVERYCHIPLGKLIDTGKM